MLLGQDGAMLGHLQVSAGEGEGPRGLPSQGLTS